MPCQQIFTRRISIYLAKCSWNSSVRNFANLCLQIAVVGARLSMYNFPLLAETSKCQNFRSNLNNILMLKTLMICFIYRYDLNEIFELVYIDYKYSSRSFNKVSNCLRHNDNIHFCSKEIYCFKYLISFREVCVSSLKHFWTNKAGKRILVIKQQEGA